MRGLAEEVASLRRENHTLQNNFDEASPTNPRRQAEHRRQRPEPALLLGSQNLMLLNARTGLTKGHSCALVVVEPASSPFILHTSRYQPEILRLDIASCTRNPGPCTVTLNIEP